MPKLAEETAPPLQSEAFRDVVAGPDHLDLTHGLGRALVGNFYLVVKTLGMFDPANVLSKQAVASFLSALRDMLAAEGEAVLRMSSDCLFVNETRLRIDFEGFASFRYIVDSMKDRQIGAVFFGTEVREKDLISFLRAFHECDSRHPEPRREIESALAAAGVVGITLGEPWELPERPDPKARDTQLKVASVDTYFKSIYVARQFMQNVRGGQGASFQRVKRLVHTIVDLVAQDDSTLLALTQIKNFDNLLFTHSANVCVLSVALGQSLGLDKDLLGKLGLSAMLHDMGMTEIPKEVLTRRDELTPEERELYERHPLIGARAILKAQGASEASIRCAVVAFEHHLHEDGAGFPAGVARRPSTLLSRIVAITDFYDSVTTPPPTGEATFTPEEALRLMVHGGRDVFDPVLVKLFVNTIGTYPLGTMVLLDTGETGVVHRRCSDPGEPDRPRVKVTTDTTGQPVAPFEVDLTEWDEQRGAHRRSIVEAMAPSEVFSDIIEFTELL
jgi:HD-GYP domain-containing protein (c-di-GMP phosphodiesterase class II)